MEAVLDVSRLPIASASLEMLHARPSMTRAQPQED